MKYLSEKYDLTKLPMVRSQQLAVVPLGAHCHCAGCASIGSKQTGIGAASPLGDGQHAVPRLQVGASGGGLVSVLAACGVRADRVLEHAYALSLKFNIWDRPMGLVGVWGKLIEQVCSAS